jgi:hypothetical protein
VYENLFHPHRRPEMAKNPTTPSQDELPPFPSLDELKNAVKDTGDHLAPWALLVSNAIVVLEHQICELGKAKKTLDTVVATLTTDSTDPQQPTLLDLVKYIQGKVDLLSPATNPLDPKTVADLIKLIDLAVAAAATKKADPGTSADEQQALDATMSLLSAFKSELAKVPASDPAPVDFKNEVLRQIKVRQLTIPSS